MCKIDRVIKRCNSLIEELYYTGSNLSNQDYYNLSQRIERMLKYLSDELKHSKIAQSRKEQIETLLYIY